MPAAANNTAEREWNSRWTDGDAEASALMDLEATNLGAAVIALLEKAQDVLQDRAADANERRLADRLLDLLGPSDDCYLIAEVAGSVAQVKAA